MIDLVFPSGNQNYFNAANQNFDGRLLGRNNGGWIWTTSADAGSTIHYVQYLGVPTFQIVGGTGAAGLGWVEFNSNIAAIRAILQSGHGIVPSCNDYHCYRIVTALAWQNIPTADCDWGLEYVFNATAAKLLIVRDGANGFGFVRRASGSVSFVVRGPAGLQFFDITPAFIVGFDPTQWHVYEFRVIGATKTTEAQLKVMVDGVVFKILPWGAGTLLPTYSATNPQANAALCGLSGGNFLMNLQFFNFIVGSSEAATL